MSEQVNEKRIVPDPEAPSLEHSVRVLLVLIKAHRTIGDSDVDAAVAGVESALASWGT